MPELPEVESARRALDPAMAGARFVSVVVRRPDLRTKFPRRFAARLTVAVEAQQEAVEATAADRGLDAKYGDRPVPRGRRPRLRLLALLDNAELL